MKLLVCIVSALLVSTIAVPTRHVRETDELQEFMEVIKMMKDPESYVTLKELSETFKIFRDLGELRGALEEEGKEKEYLDFASKMFGRFEEGLKVLYNLAKATLVEGAKPTDEQLTELAKQFSKVLREGRLNIRNYAEDDTLMTNETIDLLKQIVVENPVKVSGNTYLDAIKVKIPKLSTIANRIKNVDRHIKKAIKEYGVIDFPTATKAEEKDAMRFYSEFLFDELISLMKSEENAIVMFKNFGVITSTLKDPASYESLQALYNNFAKSKRLEAHAIIVREVGKCLGAEMNTEQKMSWREHFPKAMELAKSILADGQDASKVPEMVTKFKENDAPVLSELLETMESYEKTLEGRKRFRKCLVTDADREVYREATKLSGPVFSDDQMNNMKNSNEKVYALVQLVNSAVRAVRRREGLGAEADAIFKEMLQTPHVLLHLSQFFNPSQETLDKIEEQKKVCAEKYNALSADSKKQIVDVFPYRSLINMAIAD